MRIPPDDGAPHDGAPGQRPGAGAPKHRSADRSPQRGQAPAWPRPDWEERFRAPRIALPLWARRAPERGVVVASAGGVLQVHSVDVRSGRLTVATDRPEGTDTALIDPHGRWIWWFDDTAGDQFGVWRRQPWGSSPRRRPETPIRLSAAYGAGLLLGADGTAVVGRSSPTYGTQVHQVMVGPAGAGTDLPVLLYAHRQDAEVAALSQDANLVAIEHSERGDNRHPALRVIAADTGRVVGDLDDGAGRGLWALAFAPLDGDERLLVRHERAGRPELAVWDPVQRREHPVTLGLEGDVADADWYPDGRSLLVTMDHHARARMYRHDLATGLTTAIGPADGTVEDAAVRPDGDVWFVWSSAAQPRSVRSTRTGREVVSAGARAPSSVGVRDVWVDGPGGRVHALVREPAGEAPFPTVVAVHGGPTWHDADVFSAEAAAWVDHGFAVVQVNYRGSTGYGSAWRDAFEARVGFTELADVAAVHDALVAGGLVDPERSVLAGASWGGYLTLLGLGTQPERWTLGVAAVPLADWATAYDDELDSLRAFDRSLFGGSPAEAPEAYREASPLTYVGAVRAPVLVLAGENDPQCPIRQVEEYVRALRAAGGVCEEYRFDAGHGSLVDDERVRQMRAMLDFTTRHLAG